MPQNRALSDHADAQVAIVGAGPVGLLLATLLGQQGVRTLLLERRATPPARSQAIGITPPSLEILEKAGLSERFVSLGVKIRRVRVHGDSGPLGICDFGSAPDPYPFVLSLPQRNHTELLEETATDSPHVTLRRGATVTDITQDASGVTLRIDSEDGFHQVRARWAVACDGSRSRLRNALEIPVSEGEYDCHFLMGDFPDTLALGEDAHLWFTAQGAVESFPLPGKERRWIVQTDNRVDADSAAAAGLIQQCVLRRAGLTLDAQPPRDPASFTPRWLRCERLHAGRVILCGDAAHVMSPIGGQGMNTGFADAEFLAAMLPRLLEEPDSDLREAWLLAYQRIRGHAADVSRRRAAAGMSLGALRGPVRSWFRDRFMRHALFHPLMASLLSRWFSMRNVPRGTLRRVPPSALPEPLPPGKILPIRL